MVFDILLDISSTEHFVKNVLCKLIINVMYIPFSINYKFIVFFRSNGVIDYKLKY